VTPQGCYTIGVLWRHCAAAASATGRRAAELNSSRARELVTM
jgi:hypothetical protein